MDEQFLHYVWKFQKFLRPDLSLIDGSILQVFNPGYHNQDSGPDFEEARIKINDIEWAGHIEIHIRSSDWTNHKHQLDKAYETVILHVVWEHDKTITINGDPLPTLELNAIVSHDLYERYRNHIASKDTIPCRGLIQHTNPIRFSTMLDRALVERLRQKAESVLTILSKTNNDWEETTYRTIAASFGFSINKPSFEILAESLPFKILSKHTHHLKETEALVYGQAGFLDNARDDHGRSLQHEYEFLKKKYELTLLLKRSHWKFGKMRPPNFPTVRLAQFSSLLTQQPHLFSKLLGLSSSKEIIKSLEIRVEGYWATHYDFAKKNTRTKNKPGKSSYYHLAINTIAPIFAAYSRYTDNYAYMTKAIELLEHLPGESNRLTKQWVSLGKKPENAFTSQALIGLTKNYCTLKRCLQCDVGIELLTRE